MKKIAFLINGTAKRKEILKLKLINKFDNYQLSFHVSTYAGEAVEFAQEVINNRIDYLIVVGGDGTINEVVNGCMKCQKVLLDTISIGVLPYGSGNDFSKSLGIKKDLDQLKKLIENNISGPVDIGKIDYINSDDQRESRYFINITDVGIGGVAAEKLSKSRRLMGAKITYHKVILQSFFSYKPVEIDIKSDAIKWKGKILSLCMANGNYFANGMCIAPQANLSDGKIQLVIMGKVSIFDYIKNLSNVKKGKILEHPEITYVKVDSCIIDAKKRSCPIDMDGEFIGYAPLELKVIKAGLNFLQIN